MRVCAIALMRIIFFSFWAWFVILSQVYYYSNLLPFHLNFLSFSVTSGNVLVRVRSFFALFEWRLFLVVRNMIATWYSLIMQDVQQKPTDETSVSPLFFFFRKEENKQKKLYTKHYMYTYEAVWKKWEWGSNDDDDNNNNKRRKKVK